MAQEGNPTPPYEALSMASWTVSLTVPYYHTVKIDTGLGICEGNLPDITLSVNLFAENQNDHDDLKGPKAIALR